MAASGPEPLRVLCLLGPTGAGKNAAALALPRPVGVVNFDSRQIYRHVPIVTAQPDAAERAQAPHWLYGFLGPTRSMSAARFAGLARRAAARCASLGRLPVLVGGTGLYLRVLLEGIAPIPPIPEAVRAAAKARVAAQGPQAVHAWLAERDPDYAAVIHPNDTQRTTRALEVLLATGRTMSQWHAAGREGAGSAGEGGEAGERRLDALVVGLRADLDALTPRLAARIEAMLAAGALEEARRLKAICPDRSAPVYSAIGCPELRDHLDGTCTLDEAKARWLKNTRAYAKRQLTWCRKAPGLVWMDPADHAGLARLAAERFGG
ncbi:MAG: tRNA (adenosine(37)-N6)-dimethylallyltransferase MiaA [Desulfovibrionaceae bacterium]